ncbi:MAG: hypothetical protein HQK50_07545 [Oligoflexia bacterium]|nr:hypothetical protein [Oligoflexia bacterium]MBF0365409.1 hypothetical protein [Oligoflexia bacterium]
MNLFKTLTLFLMLVIPKQVTHSEEQIDDHSNGGLPNGSYCHDHGQCRSSYCFDSGDGLKLCM